MNSSSLANGVSRATRAKRSESAADSTVVSSSQSSAESRPDSLQATRVVHKSRLDSQQQQQQPAAAKTTRLVFGLSSRTNRLKHDEYAEKRSQLNPATAAAAASTTTPEETSTSNRSAAMSSDNGSPADSNRSTGVRPSRLGNFYRPPEPVLRRSDRSPARNQVSNQQVQEAQRAAEEAKLVERELAEPKSRKKSDAKVEKKPDVRAEKKVDAKAEKKPDAKAEKKPDTKPEQNQEPKPDERGEQKAARMQFNIPPPKQQTSTRSSVVSYAKARIYADRQPAASAGHSPLLEAQTIPVSILSGFKPPKQVNVSKACEKWEGGEPFAKSKSRQRLAAAQAVGKKLHGHLHGTWSMTSVVATQQLQLQQALAASATGGRHSSGADQPSVKILTRGSVLERVQQFEKAPATTTTAAVAVASAQAAGTATPELPFASSTVVPEATANVHDEEQSSASEITISATPIQLQETTRQVAYKTRVSSIQSADSAPDDQLIGSTHQSSSSLAYVKPLSRLRRRSSTSTTNSNSSGSSSAIPKFYHPNGKPPNTYEIELQKKNIVACFDKLPDRKAHLTGPSCRRHFHSIALACGFSEYFKEPLYLYVRHQLTNSNLLHGTTGQQVVARKQSTGLMGPSQPDVGNRSQPRLLTRASSIDTSTMEKIQRQTFITCDQFLTCWRQMIGCCFDNASRFVHLLTLGQRTHLLPDDLVPLVQSVIEDHPGLKFLRAAPDFHLRYIQTVIARIFYCLNKSWTGKISITELRQSNLLAVLQVLSQEEDINQITDYFSYEHFYVIYCKFWALDTDHDLLISREDLARHNDAAISSRIIERLFTGIVSKHVQQTGKMSYSDFVWFLIAEEDKKHPRAIEYWFRLMDLDGDGYVSMYEMEYFYYEQSKRLELMNIEALPFLDSACQILDLVNPKEKNKISLSDLKRTKMATIFFDTFINLEKYLEHESREFVSTRDVTQGGVVISDWDRYASEEYESLVSEETSSSTV